MSHFLSNIHKTIRLITMSMEKHAKVLYIPIICPYDVEHVLHSILLPEVLPVLFDDCRQILNVT